MYEPKPGPQETVSPFRTFAGLRISGITAFGIVIIAFFFTFCQVSCGAKMSYTGIDLALDRPGTYTPLENGYTEGFFPGDALLKDGIIEGQKVSAKKYHLINLMALSALICAGLALLLSFIPVHRYAAFTALVGVWGTISLLWLKIDMQRQVAKAMTGGKEIENIVGDMSAYAMLSVRFLTPFWIAMFVMFAGTFISFLRWSEDRRLRKKPQDNW